MKQKFIYFLIPLAGLLVFGYFYWNFSNEYDAQQEAKVVAAKMEKQKKLEDEAKLREKAIKDALADQERRKAEKKAQAEKDRLMHEERENSIQARNKVGNESEKLARSVERLTKDVQTAKEEIAKIEADKAHSATEVEFLKQFVIKAQADTKTLATVLDKIEAADESAAKAAAAAAAAAKKSSS